MIDSLMAENKTTGTDQSDAMINYAKMNIQRMQRIDKTTVIGEELKSTLGKLNRKLIFYVLTEGWCGDAAQNVPVLAILEQHTTNIELRLLLRDQNLEIMDQYLTNGGRSIPKLICVDAESGKELFEWGPRPQACQEIMLEMKKAGMEKTEIGEKIHAWYAKDKTHSLQKELVELLHIVL